MNSFLKVKGLSVGIPGQRQLVDSVSLTVEAGERVALLGRSGSGKSLIAAAVAGTVSPALEVSGSAAINGAVQPNRRSGTLGIALVQQDSSDALNPLVKVGVQLAMPGVTRGESQAKARRQCVDLLEQVGLEDPERILNSFPAELSGGQRQRICIALALACRAEMVIADEPTTALDVITQAAVIEAFQANRWDNTTLLFITHDLAVVSALCERAVVVEHGRIVEDTTIEELFTAPVHPVSQSLVAEARVRSELAAA